jgi:hypothetical protein
MSADGSSTVTRVTVDAGAPLTGEWLQPIQNEAGHAIGVVALPLGETTPRRVIVGVHGAASRADFMCSVLRSVLGPREWSAGEGVLRVGSGESAVHASVRSEGSRLYLESRSGPLQGRLVLQRVSR